MCRNPWKKLELQEKKNSVGGDRCLSGPEPLAPDLPGPPAVDYSSANAIEITRFATPVMLITVKMELNTRNVLCETKPATRRMSINEEEKTQ